IFDALGTLGITYVSDPNNPYSTIAETPEAVDAVSYPRETLARRTGDCDDTTVLLAALLGNVGISTQFVDVPGHLFLLVDTGIHERNRLSLAVDESRYVVADDEVWIPLETTAIKEGFPRAWEIGAEAYASWSRRGKLALASVQEAQTRFEPAEVSGDAAGPQVEEGVGARRGADDVKASTRWNDDYWASRYGASAAEPVSPAALNELAHVYFLAGRLDEARAKLEDALPRGTNPARTENNLGDILAAQGDLTGALAHYASAVATEDESAGPWLNLGLVRYASGDTSGAEEPLSKGLQRSGSYTEACRLLGLEPGVAADRQGTEKMSAEEARQLLKDALKRIPRGGRPASARPDSLRTTKESAPKW